jgi:hypothetical protein
MLIITPSSPLFVDLADGTRLEIRSEKVGKDGRADERQQWTLKTDGSIVSGTNSSLGLGGRSVIELVDSKKSRQHISWSVFYGHYENDILIRFRRYILTMASQRSKYSEKSAEFKSRANR